MGNFMALSSDPELTAPEDVGDIFLDALDPWLCGFRTNWAFRMSSLSVEELASCSVWGAADSTLTFCCRDDPVVASSSSVFATSVSQKVLRDSSEFIETAISTMCLA